MAEYSDGSMIVDTEIDTEGFLKDSEKLKKAVASLTKQVDSIGQQMKTAIARNNAAAVETLKRRFTEAQGQAEALRNKIEGFSHVKVLSDDYIRITDEIKKADTAMQRLIERQEKLKAMGADKASVQWQNTQNAIEETTAKLEEYKRRLTEAREDLAFMNTPEQRAEAHAEGPEGWAMYTQELARLKQQLIDDQSQADKLTEALAKLTTRQEQLKASGADQGSRQYQSLLYDMEQLRAKQEELNAARDKMESEGTAFKMGNTTQEFEQLNRQMSETEQHMEQVEQAKERAFSVPSGFVGFLSGVARGALNAAVSLAKIAGNGALSYLRKLAAGAKNAAIQLMKLAGSAIASGIRRIGTLASAAGKALLGLGRNAKKSNGGLNAGLKALLRYGLGIRSVFALLNKLRSAVKEAFENMAKKVPEVNQTLSALTSSLDRVKNSLATAFQPILTAIAPYLIQFMDMLSGALTKVGEFFAALTGQQYVYKATKAQIDYAKSLDKTKKSAKEAENQLAGFDDLDILKDKSKETKEETPTSDFEKVPIEASISDFAKRIKAAFEGGDFYEIGKILAEKVYGWFAAIDWVKVGTIIGKGIMALVDIVLGFSENFPWAEVGKRLANGLNALFDNIDPVKIAKAIIAVFNGALDALLAFIETFKWEKHGKKLAAGIRQFIKDLPVEKLGEVLRKGIVGILKFIRPALADRETWNTAGKKLGTLLNELFKGKPGKDNIWTELEGAIVDLARDVVTALSGFVATFKWGENGKVFHDAVFRLVDDFPLNELGAALMDLLKGSLEFMNETFGDQTLFDNLGRKLADFMNTVFSKEETWEEIGETANNMLKDVLAFGNGALDDFDAGAAADAIKTALKKIEWETIASETWRWIKSAFSKTGDFLDALFSEEIDPEKAAMSGEYLAKVTAFNQSSLGTKIGTRISQAIASIDWKQFGSDLSRGATNLLNNFADALNQLTKRGDNGRSPIEDSIISFIEGIDKEALAESVKGALRAVADVIAQTFGTVLNEAFDALFSDPKGFDNGYTESTFAADPLMGAGSSSGWAGKTGKLADAGVDGFVGELEKRKSDVDNAMTATFMDQYEKIEGTPGYDIGSPSKRTEKLGGYVAEGFINGLEGKKSSAADAVDESLVDPYETNVEGKEGFDVGSDKSQRAYDLGENITESFAKGLEWFQNSISQRVRDVFTGFNKAIVDTVTQNDWQAVGSGITSGIQSGINNGWNWLHDTVWNLAQSLLNAAKSALGIHSPSRVFRDQVGKMLGLGVAEGVEDSEPTILDSVAGVADAMAAEMKDAKLTADIGAKGSGLDNALSSFADKVVNSFSNLMDRLEAIADSVTFRMPAVATGSVVPYSVSGSAGSASGDVATALMNANAVQTDAMIQMFNNSTLAIVRAIEENCHFEVKIGDQVIGEASLRWINRKTKMTGKPQILM